MKVRKTKTTHLYTHNIQRGGLAIYRGERLRGGRFSLRFLAPLAKVAFKMAKKVVKKAAPKAMGVIGEAGLDYLSGKSNLKGALKTGLKKGRNELQAAARAALEQELSAHENQKGRGGGLMWKKNDSIYPSKYSWY